MTARDLAIHQALSSSVNLTVHVLDVNDCLPMFERPLYRAIVSVDCPVGHEVRNVQQLQPFNNNNNNAMRTCILVPADFSGASTL